MPIRPDLRKHYETEAWKVARDAVVRRSEGRCEFCGVMGGEIGYRDHCGDFQTVLPFADGGSFEIGDRVEDRSAHPFRYYTVFRIVLTCAHLDHNPEDPPRVDRLAHLCQQCHNRHDAPHRAKERRRRKRRAAIKAGQRMLFYP